MERVVYDGSPVRDITSVPSTGGLVASCLSWRDSGRSGRTNDDDQLRKASHVVMESQNGPQIGIVLESVLLVLNPDAADLEANQESFTLKARMEAIGPTGRVISVNLKLCGDAEDMLRGAPLCARLGAPELLQWEFQLAEGLVHMVSIHVEVRVR